MTHHPLVLLHANITDSRMWDDNHFAADFQVIRYDRPGFGDTPLRQSSPRTDLLNLLNEHRLDRAHLLGCSMGGEIALDFALQHPDRVSALILVSTTPSGFELQGDPPKELPELLAALEAGDLQAAADLQNRMIVDGIYRTPSQVNPRVRERIRTMNLIALRNGAAFIPDPTPLTPPAIDRLAEVNLPTLIIVGGVDHPEILRAADVMAAGIPNAQKVVIPNTGHFPNMENPPEFNRIVREFLL